MVNEQFPWSTHQAAFSSALTAHELGFGGICVRPLFFSKLLYGDRVSGRTYAGASCPMVSVAREASTLSLATRHAGFSRRGVDPVGETPNVPDTPLGSRRLVVSPPAPANRRHPWYSHPNSRKSQESPRSQPTPRSRERGRLLSPSPPRQRGSASSTQTQPESTSIPTCIWSASPADRDANPVRQFGANTADLQEIAAWLKKCRVKTIALESTGVYWIPLFKLLESEGFEVYLVEPGQLSRCGARPKTDVLDAQWIQRLHSYGLLRASFRPPDFVLALRAYWRQRQMQVRYAAGHVQHMQKALEQMNVKLPEVVSDITGLTGMSIIEAILEGERDPIELAKLRDGRCHHSEDEIALALEGTWRPEHLFELRQAYELHRFHQQRITECDQQVRAELEKFENRAGEKTRTVNPRKREHKKNDVRFDAKGPLFQALGVDLTLIEGIDVGTALVILAEIGVDVSRFPTEKHFASWLRLCPPQNQSNKTKKRRGRRKGTSRVTIALRLAARSVGKTMDLVQSEVTQG
jgi:transposase